MKIYLDMCCLQRPLDSPNHPRIVVEAEAILAVLELCESGQLELIRSDALAFELERNPHPMRKRYGMEVLATARHSVQTNSRVEERARSLHGVGIKPLDALHLASAIEAGADYFCTCDDRFLKRAKTEDTLDTLVVSPIEMIAEISK